MKCPVCNVNLVMSERQGVEIDYCPECRGVWLDRGELDKIIDKASSDNGRVDSSGRSNREDTRPNDYKADYPKNDPDKKRKRESWIGDIFDF